VSNADIHESAELIRLAELGWNANELGPVIDHVRFVGDAVEVDYPEAGLEALGLEGGSGYWFDHRARAVVEALHQATSTQSIWDIGAGTGSMARRLSRQGFDVVAVEPLADGARAIARQQVAAVFCSSLEQLSLPDGCLRVLGLFDVIEHIEHPAGLLAEVRRVLEPEGIVAVTVPAFQGLWSDEDEVAGHKRRYRRAELDGFMTAQGFRKVDSRYLFASLVVPAAVLRAIPHRLGRRRSEEATLASAAAQLTPSPVIDRTIRRLLHLERASAEWFNLPIGTSVLGIYRRN
jgi:2-polyprenyl-3-methyl-5-hydroxy-6-metoxy-1,4-benzoquinol methylase